MSGFGSLYVGVSGLQTAQDALNTTAHNLANVETEGYVRQQILQGDKQYNKIGYASVSNMQVGLGVTLTDVRQVRDEFLDKEYRKETGRAGFYDVCYEAAAELEGFFQELDGASYQDCLKELWQSIAELEKDPTKVDKEYFVLKASEFLQRSVAINDSMKEYQNNLNLQVLNQVNKINELGEKIKYLNDKVVGIELSGVEEANDYKDARNKALDELSKYANITYDTDPEGFVTVKIEGSQFVTKDYVNKMSCATDSITGFYTPIWKHEGNAEVFDLSLEISTENDTNVGSLKALIMARGDHHANYTDISSLNQAVKDSVMTDEEAARAYEKNIGYSVVMKVQAEFDQLVHGVVDMINDVLCIDNYSKVDGTNNDKEPPTELFIRIGEAERYEKDTNGDYVKDTNGYYVQLDECGYLVGEDGKPIPDKNGNYQAVREGATQYNRLYTVGNLMINPAVLANSGLIKLEQPTGETDYTIGQLMIQKWNESFATLNPTEEGEMNFSTYYTAMTDALANQMYVYQGISEGQQAMAAKTDSARQEIMGVSSDDELTNMIKFQNAYNASSRYINVVNEMLEHLLNTLGA